MNNPIAVSPNRQPVSRQVSKAGTGAARSKWIVAIVMGFFYGILLYMLLALTLSGKAGPSGIFTFMTFFGGWVISAYLMLKGAKTVSKTVSRGFLIGASEWLLLIPATLIFTGKAASDVIVGSGGSNAAAVGATLGMGFVTFLTGTLAFVHGRIMLNWVCCFVVSRVAR